MSRPISRLSRKLRDVFPLRMLRRKAIRYDEDGLISTHSAAFSESSRFQKAYALGKSTGSWANEELRWRAHVACWAAEMGMKRQGDFVECGVNRGGLARTVLEYAGLSDANRRFWLLDTFKGLDDSVLSESERDTAERWKYQECYEDVLRTFSGNSNVHIVRGTVPDTLIHVVAESIAYLSLDMNCAGPEVAAFRHFWPKLTPGAVVLLDDYGWTGHDEQRLAFDALAEEMGFPILSLPTGQAIIVRPP